MTVTELNAIPNPPNKRSRYDFQPLPTKRATHNSDPSQQKAEREALSFPAKRAGTKPTLFNRESMQFSQRSSTTESDRFP